MIVYGDPEFSADVRDLIDWLHADVRALQGNDLDQLRAVLIRAGQLEQALADAPLEVQGTDPSRLEIIQDLTDCAARAFLQRLRNGASLNLEELCERLHRAAKSFGCVGQVQVKVPEGFEFYTLFPEQYCAAADAWLRDWSATATRDAFVIGIRGIGTTLSAVVAVCLQNAGWNCRRVTVRPTGHPFERDAHVNAPTAPGVAVLIVDEGPGISGSSMAAVARALYAQGFPRERISFFPGHSGEPGAAASREVREIWASTRRYVSSLECLRWDGLNADRWLQRATETSCGGQAANLLHDFPDHPREPFASGRFARDKRLCTLKDGRAVLWRWAGLGAWIGPNASMRQLIKRQSDRLSIGGWIMPPVGFCHGFLGAPWCDAEPLTQETVIDDLPERLSQYIATAARPGLAHDASEAAVARLKHLIATNLAEAFGSFATFDHLVQAAKSAAVMDSNSYGDGRLGPWEWRRTASGQVHKADWWSRLVDHTAVGGQSVLWDFASAAVDWGWQGPARERLLKGARDHGLTFFEPALAFYELGYAAFCLGQATLCLDLEPSDSPHRSQLAHAQARYRACCQALVRGET